MEIFILCIAAFLAGFVDAIVGGGGLIQTPVALVTLPQYPVSTVLGSLKIPSFSGTSFAAVQYAKKVKLNIKQLALMMSLAFAASFAGSELLTLVSNAFMKPVLLFVLIAVAIYTYSNKQLGIHTAKAHTTKQQWWYFAAISIIIGFYDGFIGPGAGSFLILAFVGILGFDFLKASANAKFINLATNLGSICLFLLKGKILFAIALPMAVCNAIGGYIGAKLALLRGNHFVRMVFLVVVCGTILRFAYDIFWKK